VAITPVAPVGDRKNRQDSDPRSGYPEVVHSTLAGAGRAPERTGVRTPASKEVCAVTTVQELTPQPVVTVRDSVAPEALLALFERRFAQLAGHLAQRGAAPAGQPFAIYHAMSAEAVDIELGMPVVDPVAGGGEVVAGELPAGRAAVLTHHGPYDTLPAAHAELAIFVKGRGLQPSGPPREIYVTDPGTEPDPARWRTDVVQPVA
jgi:effector-binding domain-containing protein